MIVLLSELDVIMLAKGDNREKTRPWQVMSKSEGKATLFSVKEMLRNSRPVMFDDEFR